MEIRIDRDKCVSGGVCAMFAPQVFDQDDDGVGVVNTTAPPEAQAAAIRSVIWRCPGHAISTHEKSPLDQPPQGTHQQALNRPT